MPPPFLISAFVNWMAYKLTSPFALQRLNSEIDSLRLGVYILLGMTGAVGYQHLEDLLQPLKAAKLILVNHPLAVPSKLVAYLREEDKEWKGAQEDFQRPGRSCPARPLRRSRRDEPPRRPGTLAVWHARPLGRDTLRLRLHFQGRPRLSPDHPLGSGRRGYKWEYGSGGQQVRDFYTSRGPR